MVTLDMRAEPALEEDDEIGRLDQMVGTRRDEVDRVDDVHYPPRAGTARRLILKLT